MAADTHPKQLQCRIIPCAPALTLHQPARSTRYTQHRATTALAVVCHVQGRIIGVRKVADLHAEVRACLSHVSSHFACVVPAQCAAAQSLDNCIAACHVRCRCTSSAVDARVWAVGDTEGMFEAARCLFASLSSSSSSSSSKGGDLEAAVQNLNRLFTAFSIHRVSALRHLPVEHSNNNASAAAAAAAADSTHVLALAHATLQALNTVLDPPHTAALSVRTLLQKAVKAFKSLKRELMRPSAISPQPPRRSRSAETRSSSVAEAMQLQVLHKA
jgi:hypothetical protein